MNAEEMITRDLIPRGIQDRRVINAMRRVPREHFVPENLKHLAYADQPLPIGDGQTISQPYIVAFMTEALELSPGMRVLEIGTGCGYQTAILAAMGLKVYTVEIRQTLLCQAQSRLEALGYGAIHFLLGDGRRGWPEKAPFDGILAAAAPEVVPPMLLAQLGEKSRMIMPVGPRAGVQQLNIYKKK